MNEKQGYLIHTLFTGCSTRHLSQNERIQKAMGEYLAPDDESLRNCFKTPAGAERLIFWG
jgi:hypothetical protein